MKVKICGLTRLDDAAMANAHRPDFVGFVFARSSKRRVSREIAEEMRGALDPSITPVGVFVDEDPREIASLVRDGVISMIQLHGSEDERYIAHLRELVDAPIIKAFNASSGVDARAVRSCSADLVLLDGGAGDGRTFDWSDIDVDRPFFLAGGLTPENVGAAIARVSPFAVDVSSGVETDGHKDEKKIAAFVAAVKG